MVCLVGGLLAYIFRTQVVTTIQAEMIADIRGYDPDTPEAPVTRAWDLTQQRLQCCGLMTEKVTQSWQMWRFNRNLNPGDGGSLVVPRSCCVTDQVRLLTLTSGQTSDGAFQVCVSSDNQTIVEKVWPGDCRELSLNYVLDKARMMGVAAFAMSGFTVNDKET